MKRLNRIFQMPYYFLMDNVDLILGRRDRLTPPKRMIFFEAGDFKKIGEAFVKYFIELCNLRPDEKILDVGCGIGRIAVGLTKYLDEKGSYEGFDIAAQGIEWCKNNISRKYPNFHFRVADIFNKAYNPDGKCAASEYKFPYKDGSFDFVFLASVFTHMLPRDMENYFSEIARVLKTDGRCFITFFLLNAESKNLINANLSRPDLRFYYDEGKYCTTNELIPETAIAYDEKFVLSLYKKYKLNIKEPTFYGTWCGRKNCLTFQDIIIANKAAIP